MGERGWTHEDLAVAIGKHRPLITSLVSGKRGVTPELAILLATVLGDSPEHWLRLHAERQLSLLPQADTDQIARRARLLDLAPVRELERRGWIRPWSSPAELESELERFFGVESIEYELPVLAAARRSNPEAPIDRHQRAWIARARKLARTAPAAEFDDSRLADLVRDLRRLAAFARESDQVPATLGRYGIRFVVLEHLERSRIDGAAFWLDDNSPAIAMSLRIGRIDSFWFTLMHEVAHVMHRDAASIDVDLTGKTQIPSRLKPDAERRADEAASHALIPTDELNAFIRMFSPLYSKARIVQFAHHVKIHPGIIVGQLQHRAELGWAAGRSMLVDVREHVIPSATTEGWGHTVSPGAFD